MGMLLEIKSQLKKKYVLMLIIILFLGIAFIVNSYKAQTVIQERNHFLGLHILNEAIQMRKSSIGTPVSLENFNKIESYEEAVYYHAFLSQRVMDLDMDKDIQAYNLNRSQYNLMGWFASTLLNEDWAMQSPDERLIDPISYYGSEWETVRKKLEFPVVKDFIYKDFGEITNNAGVFPLRTIYYISLYEHGIRESSSVATTPFSFLFLLLNSKFSIVISMIAIAMGCVHIVSQYDNNLVKYKVLNSRFKFILRAYKISVLTTLGILSLVLLTTFCVLGFEHGFDDGNQPILIKKSVMGAWRVDSETSKWAEESNSIWRFGFVDSVPDKKLEDTFETQNFIFLKKALALQLAMEVLQVLFWTMLGMFIGLFVNTHIFSFILSSVLLILSSVFLKHQDFYQVLSIFEGNRTQTVPQVIVITCVGILIMSLFGYLRFKKIDVV